MPTEFVKVQRGHLPPEELAAKREETSAARERLKEEANESFTVIREAKGRVAIEVQRMAAAEIESAFATIKIVMAKGTGRDRLSAAGTILERAAGRSGSFLELHCDLSRMKPADAIDAVMGEMGKGHISVQDAQSVVNMIKLRSDVTEQTEMLKRIAALETYLASNAATKLAKADPDQALGDFMPIRTPSKSAMPN